MSHPLPPITMTCGDHVRLSYLAGLVWSRFPEFSDFLMRELDRATLVEPDEIDASIVTMGSRVEFVYADSGVREVITLVYPGDEDIASRQISVLTPVGAALIGLSEGQSIAFRTLRGKERTLTILKVTHASTDDSDDGDPGPLAA